MKIIELIKLCRPWQWYKNLLIYLALIFTSQLFVERGLVIVTLGFASLCLVSSSNYVINDIIDRKADKHHPEKKKRPLASGKVKVWEASVLAIVLITTGGYIALQLGTMFSLCVAFMFVFTQIYSGLLKKEMFIDILAIAVLFVVRAVSGAFILDVKISPWLILCTFFLSLFLSTGKRASDLALMGKRAGNYRKTLEMYNKGNTDMLMMINTTILIIAYSLYSFFSEWWLWVSIPFALYTILRFKHLVDIGDRIGRKPELGLTDSRLVVGAGMWVVSVFIVIYLV